jgi:elongation factor P
MYSTSDLKRGLVVELDGAPYVIESVTVSTPSARGANTIHKVRMRNLKTRQKRDESFRGGDSFAEPDFEKRPCQLLYRDATGLHFMDQENYEQFAFSPDDLEWEMNFLKDEMEGIQALVYNEQVIGLELPTTVVLRITDTPPAIKGASATARTKPATLETGHTVTVPEYIETGELLTVDTRTGESLGRA